MSRNNLPFNWRGICHFLGLGIKRYKLGNIIRNDTYYGENKMKDLQIKRDRGLTIRNIFLRIFIEIPEWFNYNMARQIRN